MNWSFISGFISGGLVLKLIDYCIALARERREQKAGKVTHEKDRPRFRVDVTIVPSSHPSIPTAVVKILSLGSLPITIDKGEVFIEANHYPEHVQPQKLDGREISSAHPIEVQFALPEKLVNPVGIGEPLVKLICNFSYYDKNERYSDEKTYSNRRFE